MTDEDLDALRLMLRRMKPGATVQIGHFKCGASELLWVVEEAQQARAWAAIRRAELRPLPSL